MIGLILCLSLTLTSALSSNRTLNEGKACKLRNGEKGWCRKWSECPSVAQTTNFTNPLYCQNKPSDPIICCNVEITTTTEDTPKSVEEYGAKSKEKCREYTAWLKPKFVPYNPKSTISSTTTTTTTEKLPAEVTTETDQHIFVVGGEETQPTEFPHMAHLGYGDENSTLWKCGASLISDQYLLTAAHCLQISNDNDLQFARLSKGDPSAEIIVKIIEKIPHPEYKPPANYHDIALLKLEKSLGFHNYMRPACIHTDIDIGEQYALASGWGLTSYGGDTSDRLLKVELPLVNHTECIKTYPLRRTTFSIPRGIDENIMFCAGGVDLKKDTCQGDSGGPLQTMKNGSDSTYNIIGVTSFGINCGVVPGVYTRVSYYVPWIESIVWPD